MKPYRQPRMEQRNVAWTVMFGVSHTLASSHLSQIPTVKTSGMATGSAVGTKLQSTMAQSHWDSVTTSWKTAISS